MSKAAAGGIHPSLAGLCTGVAVFGADLGLTTHNQRFRELIGPANIGPHEDMNFEDTSLTAVLRGLRSQGGDLAAADGTVPADPLTADRRQSACFRQRRNSGQVIEVQLDPLPDDGWMMVVSDISPFLQAEDEARRYAEMMDSVVRHIPHGIAVYGPDRRVTMVNAGYRVIMAGAPIELGDTLDEVTLRRSQSGEYGPGDAEAAFIEHMSIDPLRPQVRRRRRPNATTVDIRTTSLPDGGHMSVLTDVTPLVAAETELVRRAKSMDAMLANIRHGIVLWDREQRIIACNVVAEQLLSAPPGLLVPGRTLQEVIESAQARGNLGVGQVGIDTAVRLAEQDRSQSHQDQRLTRTGRVLEVRTDPTPEGGFVTTYTDVTDIRQAEKALQQARQSAEAANTAKSRFLAAMSHELRTPLNTVVASSELITRSLAGPGSAPILDAAEAIQAAGRQLGVMIDTILDVARLEAGRFDMSEDQVDLGHLVRSCLRQSDAAAAAAEVALSVELPEALPGVRGDGRRLRQALHHLVANGVKFTGAGGQVCIRIQRDEAAGDLLLKVSDTGIGIAEADLDRVFEPFAYANAALTQRFPGSGLGLYVSRALIRAHGGELVLRSRPGEGTTAVMRIPAERLLPAGHDLVEDTI